MKVRVTFMTENDEHLDENISDEELQELAEDGWRAFAALLSMRGSDKMKLEKVEIVER